jgi:hypothetical protein
MTSATSAAPVTAPSVDVASPPKERLALALLIGFALVYSLAFLWYCARDNAPRGWDESYFLYHPTAVVTALEHDGFRAASRTFWETGYAKPPLGMFGTLAAMLAFGHGSVAFRVDNLLVTLAAMWLAYRLMRTRMAPPLAAVFASGLAVAPYAMVFSRTEFAELYLWCTSLLFLVVLLKCDAFRARGWTLLLGVAFGLGMLCKLSFPLVLGPPTLWVFASALLRDGRNGLGRRIANALMAGAIGACLFVPFYAKNWQLIRAHFVNQFGWVGKEYSIGEPLTAAYFAQYFEPVLRWYGEMWMWFGALAVGLALVCVAMRRHRELLAKWPAGTLLAGALVSLVYCYFHPVPDPRFTYGTMLMLQLSTAFLLARSLAALALDRAWVAGLLLVPFLCALATNSFWPDGERVLDRNWPALGSARHTLFPPEHGDDLAAQVLALQPVAPGQELWIALAGDHLRFNNDSIRLLMLRRHIAGEVIQLGYFGPEPTMRERFLRSRRAVLWAVVIDSGAGQESSWAARYAPEALATLRANDKTFEELSWTASLPHSVEVRLFRRTVPFDETTLLDPPANPATPRPR